MKPGSLQGILNDRPYAHAKSVDKVRCRPLPRGLGWFKSQLDGAD